MVWLYLTIGLLAILVAMYLFLIWPGKRRDFSAFLRMPIAHRGLHTEDAEAPENTIEAFRRAREAGYGVELDVQFTADRQIVVFHDRNLRRLCGADIRVQELTYAQLQAYPIQGSDQTIPLFTEVLTVLGDTPLVCELKSHGANKDTALCEAVAPLLQAYPGPVCMESFNPFMVQWFRKHCPGMPRGILAQRYGKEMPGILGKALSALLSNMLTRPDFLAIRHTDHRLFTFRLCRTVFRTHALGWTTHSPAEHAEAMKHFDNVIFEQYHPNTEGQK